MPCAAHRKQYLPRCGVLLANFSYNPHAELSSLLKDASVDMVPTRADLLCVVYPQTSSPYPFYPHTQYYGRPATLRLPFYHHPYRGCLVLRIKMFSGAVVLPFCLPFHPSYNRRTMTLQAWRVIRWDPCARISYSDGCANRGFPTCGASSMPAAAYLYASFCDAATTLVLVCSAIISISPS